MTKTHDLIAAVKAYHAAYSRLHDRLSMTLEETERRGRDLPPDITALADLLAEACCPADHTLSELLKALDAPGPKTFTVFCRASDDSGTTWIDEVQADSTEAAQDMAREACAADWECSPDGVACVGVAEGSVAILHWQDLSDD